MGPRPQIIPRIGPWPRGRLAATLAATASARQVVFCLPECLRLSPCGTFRDNAVIHPCTVPCCAVASQIVDLLDHPDGVFWTVGRNILLSNGGHYPPGEDSNPTHIAACSCHPVVFHRCCLKMCTPCSPLPSRSPFMHAL